MNSDELAERLLNYSVRIIKLCDSLPSSVASKHIGDQLLRSGTAGGANYEEARGAESRADFLHKVNIALKEIRESLYWLKVLHKIELIKPERLENIMQESNELCAILVSTSKSTKSKKEKNI